jgi:hypothetical protein
MAHKRRERSNSRSSRREARHTERLPSARSTLPQSSQQSYGLAPLCSSVDVLASAYSACDDALVAPSSINYIRGSLCSSLCGDLPSNLLFRVLSSLLLLPS